MSWERDIYFFSHVPSVLPYISDKYPSLKSKKEGKDQESIQSM